MTKHASVGVFLSATLLAACSGSADGETPLDAGDAGGDLAVLDGTDETDAATDSGIGDSIVTEGGSDAVDGSDSGPCVDTCAAPKGGITWSCRKRFMYGLNYAWRNFGGDFGGLATWGQKGVAGDVATYQKDLADMHAHGVSVIRWWMFPELRGEGVSVDTSGTPTGLGATTLADLAAALDLAEKNDVYLMLTLFSFDGFRATRTDSGLKIPGIQPLVIDATRRTTFLENVVRPIAKAVQASTRRNRVIAWDVINEPEWAITGSDTYGDPAFEPNPALQAVTHAQMETFIASVVKVLRAESTAQVTVGAAAFKWAKAWSKIDQDFYQFHMYGWIDTYWPYSKKPSDYGLGDKPLVMGEFPLGPLNATPYATVVDSWWNNGYAGAMAWQYNAATAGQLAEVKAFADLHPCETRF
jgi:hypothetical protein